MHNKYKKIMIATALASSLTGITGCVGSNAVTAKVMQFNIEVVDNRYARGGLNILMAPVYGISVAVDYLVFNSLGFWTGTNPLNGKPHIFDTKADATFKINDDLDPSLKEAPIKPVANLRIIETGVMTQVDDNTLQMDITYNNGDKAVLTGIKHGQLVTYYIDGVVVSETSMAQLQAFTAS
ncbi:MAG: DUF3332 family protein [Moritella sp.]|uniref:DUF3332 family protein n=1 Tax=Moritella sp. TaxID=78556 RepID=UPI0029B4AEC2|nr:DUF3332 family protein [Moritella sp.]MDX2320777.1 DUF3332 family protein [Moritella sp.]